MSIPLPPVFLRKMFPDFSATVLALTETIVRERCGDETSLHTGRVAQFVLEQHARMPDYLRTPLRLLTLAFDMSALPFRGRSFHRLAHSRRWQQILKWKASAIGVRRDLVRFYESLIIFGWNAEVHGSGHV